MIIIICSSTSVLLISHIFKMLPVLWDRSHTFPLSESKGTAMLKQFKDHDFLKENLYGGLLYSFSKQLLPSSILLGY